MAATLTYNNPGAIYPGASATLFGSTGFGVIGGGNQIAQFPDPVSGASAMFNLLGTNYQGMTLQDAITKWSGGNSSPAYAQAVSQQTGIALNQPLTSDLLSGPQGVSLAQSMSKWETGSAFPLTQNQWQQAQTAGLSGTASTAGASVAANAGTSAVGAGDWIANYFGRAVVIILGFIFVNSGLHMFGTGVPLAPVVARAIPAKRQRVSMSHSGMPATVKLEGGPAPRGGGTVKAHRVAHQQGMMLRQVQRKSLPAAKKKAPVKGAGPKVLGTVGHPETGKQQAFVTAKPVKKK